MSRGSRVLPPLPLLFALGALAAPTRRPDSRLQSSDTVGAAQCGGHDCPQLYMAHSFNVDWRLGQCTLGMIDNATIASTIDANAPAHTWSDANDLLAAWMDAAQAAAPMCYAATAPEPDLNEQPFPGIVSPKYKLAFRTAAKVASQTAEAWMQCRFGAGHGLPAGPDFIRMAFVRNPGGRAISGFYQMMAHYLDKLKLPGTMLRACGQFFPEGAKHDHIIGAEWYAEQSGTSCVVSHLGGPVAHFAGPCEVAFSAEQSAPGMKMCAVTGLTYNQTQTTADSALLAGLYELPLRCRLVGNESYINAGVDRDNSTWQEIKSSLDLPPWLCTCESPDVDRSMCSCDAACQTDDQQLGSLFSAALTDAARTGGIGCIGDNFAGEHMWSQANHLHTVLRTDAIFRLEQLDADVERFETFYAATTGTPLPPATDGCNFAELDANVAEGGDNWIHPMVHDVDRLQGIIARSPDLQQRVCALFYHDYTCLGYELLSACQGPTDEWLPDAMSRLLNAAPLKPLESKMGEHSHIDLGSLRSYK